jgi:hypothetical protein
MGNKRILIIFLPLLFCLPLIVEGQGEGKCTLHKKETKAISRSIGEGAIIEAVQIHDENLPIPEYLHPGDCLYTIKMAGELRGYLFSTRAKGRFDYFDYSIIYAGNLTVMEVFITVYRSTHGAAICQKKWLSQFKGYQGGSLKLGSDIDAVSGGTLSATSIVSDIHRCHLFMSGWTFAD